MPDRVHRRYLSRCSGRQSAGGGWLRGPLARTFGNWSRGDVSTPLHADAVDRVGPGALRAWSSGDRCAESEHTPSLRGASGVLLTAWLWLFGGNVVLTLVRFPRWIQRTLAATSAK